MAIDENEKLRILVKGIKKLGLRVTMYKNLLIKKWVKNFRNEF